ncbi:MAG: SUMF1/EgtB/PvdO family nonheme iron enzyme [Treponema sp.]|nr:SUMF1/EgtB/PvdO family nonheme iron enzyme [Treponema sp.]
MKKTLVFLLLLTVCTALFAQQKFALVIGNGNYTSISKLRNPVNDANDMATALQSLGFTVDKVLDGNLEQMENAISRLKNRLSIEKNSYGFFFYAGHGVQSGGINYLLPVNANIPSENALRERAVSVQFMMSELNDAKNDLNIIVLDACRDNPFGWSRSGSRGLAMVSAPVGSIVVYATSANSTAADGTGRNGLFTTELLKNLRTPGINVQELFNKTGQDVLTSSGGTQHPEISLRFFGSAYLGSRPQQTTGTQQTQTTQQRPVPDNMVRINGGTFTMGSPANEPGRYDDEIQRQVTVNSFYMGKYQVTQKEYQEVMGTNPSHFKGDNLPVETVSWFNAVEYCNKLSQREGLTPAYTVNGENVTWNINANGYRLPTEAEWEYACRAGTTTAYNTGANISDSTGWYRDNSNSRTHPVGHKRANAWGLFDMHGNVWEWCWDWYGTYPSGAQNNPTGAVSGSYRVLRGGSWYDSATNTRSAYRLNYYFPYSRGDFLGFRLVRP